jgi:hypothetical protein
VKLLQLLENQQPQKNENGSIVTWQAGLIMGESTWGFRGRVGLIKAKCTGDP